MQKKDWVRVKSLGSDLWTPVDGQYPQRLLGELVGKHHRKIENGLPDIVGELGEIQQVTEGGTLRVRLRAEKMDNCYGDYWLFREEDLEPASPTEDEIFDFSMTHLEYRG
jgi:hypothetical protein